MGRSQRTFWHFVEYFFYAVISYKLKESPRELSSVSGEWPIRVKAASNLPNLSERDCGGMSEGRKVPLNVPIV